MRYPSLVRSEIVRSKNLRSKFSISSLLLAGAVSLAGLATVRDASALSGTLTSSQVVTSPRESGGAGGGATLIHTAASTSTSAPDNTTTSTTTAPADEAPARTSSSGSRRKAQTEEGGRTRRRGETSTTSTGTTTRRRSTGSGGKNVAESKDKVVRPIAPPPERPIFSISSGIESRYIFHGLDIISFNTDQRFTRETKSSAIYYLGGDASYKGAHFGATFVQSFDRLRPYVSSVLFNDTGKEFYQELDFNLDYTAHVVANILDATVGYNSFVFLNSGFKGSSYQGEILFRLAYKQIPYVTPSFSYYRYVSEFHDTRVGSLNGSLTEFRLDGLFPVYKDPMVSVAFAPYVSAVYNIDYLNWDHPTVTNSGNNVGGWSYLETGVKIPVTIAKHFTVTPYANYGTDLTSSDTLPINSHAYHDKFNKGIFGEKTLFWFGITASYTF